MFMNNGTARKFVTVLVHLLQHAKHTELRDPVSKSLVRMCFIYGAIFVLEEILRACAMLGGDEQHIHIICGQMLAAALIGNWRKVRAHLKVLSKQ
jgi:hypothetical protein